MKAVSFIGSAPLLLIIYFLTLSDSCSYPEGGRPPTTIEAINWSYLILYGKVLQTYPHHFYDTAYTAKMEVYCILRGERVPRIVNITNAGYLPGMCTATNLLPGGVYVVPLSPATDIYHAAGYSFKDPSKIEEALKTCKLNPPTYPLGVDEDTAVEPCPAGLPAGECKEH